MEDNQLYFEPWQGRDFTNGNSRILFLGESHYDRHGNNSSKFTQEIVQEYLDGAAYRYYKNIGSLLTDDDIRKVWEQIAFSNVIQVAFSNGSQQPNSYHIASIPKNFTLLLNTIKPDKVIVLSKRLWNHWLTEENAELLGSINSGKKQSNIWRYDYDGGSCTAIGICHPSRMYGRNGKVSDWAPLVRKFLAG